MASVTTDQDVDSTGAAVGEAKSKLQEMKEKWKILKSLNNDLQEALEKSDTEVQELTQKLASLHEENKGLQREKAKFLDLTEEVDQMKLSLEHCKNTEHTEQQGKKELEKICILMEDKADELLYQISISEEKNDLLRDEITRLKEHVIELERHLDAKSLELREMDKKSQETELVIEEMTVTMNQYLSIKEVLNNKIKQLTSQLEESQHENAMRKASIENDLCSKSEANGTIMYEMIQNKLEQQLIKEHMEKQNQGIQDFFMIRFLLNIALEFLWCCYSVEVFLILFYFMMRFYHSIYPDHLLLDVRRIFSSPTIEIIENILQPFLELRRVGMAPT
ncbi:myosin-11-like isoform X1 [Hyla sarda]|uniref:myosin-11-like isoform X1 n=1 Tax=Hyla sarda TaxID=327740 RepID=UPI0024C34596|nr:myosin-11-like isoform X1 [Hyla sarda]XP_056416836.1 myosin-11-like isoform X1 [Hyla sarda]XP_056416837.1 myosin-11-like isoform X1 [Hyla sarda]XP_056416838.1 myosin-11-like isoform X1 [Hyla sarda]XP_056416839.1 myosin-11-like isoform X1 [Hyla sarda]